MLLQELKTKGGRMVKTSNGPAPVSPEQNGFFSTNINHKLYIYNVLIPDVDPETGKVTWYVKHGQHNDDNKEGVIEYIKSKYFAGSKSIFRKEYVLFVINMTSHAISINSQYDPTLVDENIKGSYDKELHGGMIELGFTKHKKNMYGDRSLELFTFPQDWSIEEVKSKLESYHKGLLENKDVSIPTQVYNARPFTNDFDNKIDNVDKCLLGGCPGSGKELASLALTIRISDKKKYTNDLINVFTATIPDTLCEPLNELTVNKGMNVNGEFVDFSRIRLYIVQSWFDSHKKDLSGTTQSFLRNNSTFIESADDIPAIHSSTEVPILIAGYHDIAYRGNDKIRSKYVSLQGRVGTLLVGEGHKFLKPGNKMWKVFKKLGWKFLMPVTGTPYDLIFGNDDVLYFPPEERSIMTRQQMMLDKLNNPNSDFKHMPDIIYYAITEIYKEVIEEMRQDPRWKEDAEGMTLQKLHTAYDKKTKTFKYFEFLHRLYSRLLASDGFGDYDGLAIKNAPGLCEAAKNNLLFILPVGMNGVGVKQYIPELVRQLKDSGALGVYEPYVSYNEDMSDVKQAVEDPNKKTITFTAIKNTTGTNIKGWGSTVLMRPVGDSLTFLEQGPEGRIGRAWDGKINSGLFLMELYNTINLKVVVEEKLSVERGESKSHSDIINEILACHFFYNGTNGKFEKLDKPDFMSKLEEMSSRGNYDIQLCLRNGAPLPAFDWKVNDTTSTETTKVEINNEGNKDAKNKRQQRIKQLEFEFENEKDREKWWKNMKKKHFAKMRILSYAKGFNTLQDGVSLVNQALLNNDEQIIDFIGKGVDLIPQYMTDPEQVDIRWSNRWLGKIQKDNVCNIDTLLGLLLDEDEYRITPYNDPGFIDQIETSVKEEDVNKKVIDPFAGRGTLLIQRLAVYKNLGIDKDPSFIYYNDKDPICAEIFRKMNDQFDLGIPDENITCGKAEDIDVKKNNLKGCIVTMNGPFLKRQWKKHLDNVIEKCQPSEVITINPDPTNNLSLHGEKWRDFLKDHGVQSRVDLTDKFVKVESGKISSFRLKLGSEPNMKVFEHDEPIIVDIMKKLISEEEGYVFRGDQAVAGYGSKTNKKGEIIHHDIVDQKDSNHPFSSIMSCQQEGLVMKFSNKQTARKNDRTGRFLIVNRFFGKNNPDPVFEISNIEHHNLSYDVLGFKLYPGETRENFISVYGSKIYRFAIKQLGNGGFDINQSNFMKLKRLDLTKLWTEEEIQIELNLGDEEIERINQDN